MIEVTQLLSADFCFAGSKISNLHISPEVAEAGTLNSLIKYSCTHLFLHLLYTESPLYFLREA